MACESSDIYQLGHRWQQNDNYCKLKSNKYGVTDGYFSYNKDNDTHIHVYWSDHSESYQYQLKCYGEHMGPSEMDSCNINWYIREFESLLDGCYGNNNQGGGLRKKTLKKRRVNRKIRKTRSNRLKIYK